MTSEGGNQISLTSLLAGPSSIICPGTPANRRSGSIYDFSTVTKRYVLVHQCGYVSRGARKQGILRGQCQVLEYTLFQPGLFINYLAHPHDTSHHLKTFQTQFDFANCRAIIPEDHRNVKISFTTVQDLARVVARAVEYEGSWPEIGGLQSCDLSIQQILDHGSTLCGKYSSFTLLS
jgi:hypothetical protein